MKMGFYELKVLPSRCSRVTAAKPAAESLVRKGLKYTRNKGFSGMKSNSDGQHRKYVTKAIRNIQESVLRRSCKVMKALVKP